MHTHIVKIGSQQHEVDLGNVREIEDWSFSSFTFSYLPKDRPGQIVLGPFLTLADAQTEYEALWQAFCDYEYLREQQKGS